MDLEKVIFPKKKQKTWSKSAPPKLENHVTAKIVCVAANILHVAAIIAWVVADMTVEEAKVAGPRKFWDFEW